MSDFKEALAFAATETEKRKLRKAALASADRKCSEASAHLQTARHTRDDGARKAALEEAARLLRSAAYDADKCERAHR